MDMSGLRFLINPWLAIPSHRAGANEASSLQRVTMVKVPLCVSQRSLLVFHGRTCTHLSAGPAAPAPGQQVADRHAEQSSRRVRVHAVNHRRQAVQ